MRTRKSDKALLRLFAFVSEVGEHVSDCSAGLAVVPVIKRVPEPDEQLVCWPGSFKASNGLGLFATQQAVDLLEEGEEPLRIVHDSAGALDELKADRPLVNVHSSTIGVTRGFGYAPPLAVSHRRRRVGGRPYSVGKRRRVAGSAWKDLRAD
jgi:hypothetical protein